MSTKLHVGNIASTVLEDDLQATFAKFGPVDTVEVARDSGTGVSKGFAIVATARNEDASTAIGLLNFTQYAGRTIGVSANADGFS